MKNTYTPDKLKLLIELYPITNTYELADRLGVTYGGVKSKAAKLGLKKSHSYKIIPIDTFWTPEREKYLIDNYQAMTTDEIANNLGCNNSQVKNRCHKLKLAKEINKGCFIKGHKSFNKGKKMRDYLSPETIEKMLKTAFKKGQEPHNTKYDGHERVSKDGYIEVRVKKGKFVLKHRLVWEQLNGPIPNDHIVILKDGDRMNIDPSNLQLISRVEHAENTRNKDGYIAHILSKKSGSGKGKYDKELAIELMKNPELIDLKRTQLKLNKLIKDGNKGQTK